MCVCVRMLVWKGGAWNLQDAYTPTGMLGNRVVS